MLRTEKIIYLAGIIDGEGSLQVEIQSPRENRKYYYYSLRLIIINTNLNLMEWLVSNFGSKYNTRKKIIGRKLCYTWSICSRQAALLLEECLPWLIVKKKHAEIFIKFMNTMGKTGWYVTEETRLYRQTLYEELRKINKIGD